MFQVSAANYSGKFKLINRKLVEAEDAKMLISLRTGNFSDLFQQAADFD